MNHCADIRWYEEESDGEQPIITYLHLYLDKSKTSMKVGSLTFYPDACYFYEFLQTYVVLIV